jgi:hypothetical protein
MVTETRLLITGEGDLELVGAGRELERIPAVEPV